MYENGPKSIKKGQNLPYLPYPLCPTPTTPKNPLVNTLIKTFNLA